MTSHKYAQLFPMSPDAELADMAADVKQRGLLNPIIVLNGEVLDGRNRLRACELAEVTPIFVDYAGTDPLADVLSWNLHRRQLTASQRAMVATDLATMKQGQRNDLEPSADLRNVSQEQAAKSLGVSTRLVQSAQYVKDHEPETVEKVKAGEITVNAAVQQVKARAQAEEERKYTNPKKEKIGKGIEIACEAIKVLRQITNDDPLRVAGFQMVSKWIQDNGKEEK